MTANSYDDFTWRKSTFSGNQGNCVEVADLPDGGIAVRHSKAPAGPVIEYTEAEWEAFLKGVRAGEFDR
ncbi:MAG TPA: DUF397 domain-containing protein [Actinospica sp.]|jgi:hypothetical protein|nr:DUF397 domain-containing protein [Actinospica sp.]